MYGFDIWYYASSVKKTSPEQKDCVFNATRNESTNKIRGQNKDLADKMLIWGKDEKETDERYLCDCCYKGIHIGKTRQEETADFLPIKPYEMEIMLQGVFKVPSIDKVEVSVNLKCIEYFYTETERAKVLRRT